MLIKEIIKKAPGLLKIYRYIKFKKEYKYDCNYFYQNYLYSNEDINTIGYNILLLAHSLEKGMANKKLRYFGKEKTEEIIDKLYKYEKNDVDKNAFPYLVGINVLREYVKIYEQKKWTDRQEYTFVKNYLNKHTDIKNIDISCHEVDKKEIMKDAKIDYNKFIQSRHSIRDYSSEPLSDDDIKNAVSMALKTPTACNRQMCNIYYVKNKEKSKEIIKIGQGFGGFSKENINLFVITFDVNANYFIGERNQGWFNAGLVSMNFVNALHSLGIGSCFVQFGNSTKEEEKVKKIINIPKNERIAVLLATGYYNDKNLITASPRKNIKDIYKVVD